MPAGSPHPPLQLEACAALIASTGRQLAASGWTPATSSNFSMRLDETCAAVTASGRHKGRLGPDDILAVDIENGKVLYGHGKSSAETLLHTQVYRRFPRIGAVLHTHSRTQSVASRLFAPCGVVRFEGWELLKAIADYDSHESVLELPVFPNSQHMPDIATRVDAWLDAGKPLHGYLIDGHGLYTWGRGMDECLRHLEALEFLLACELDLKRLTS